MSANSNYYSLGDEIRKNEYNLDPDYSFTNNGSYGSSPKKILNEKIKLLIEMEQSPDKWFRYTSYELWNKNRASLAKYLNIDNVNQILLADNASESINTIIKSIEFDDNDAILATQYTYQAVLNTLDYYSKYRLNKQIEIFKVEIKFPIKSEQYLLDQFESTCKEILINRKLNLKFAVLDHISSATATHFPIEKMIKIVRSNSSKKTIILVDGAHAIGHIRLDLNDMDCDYYVSNLNKWFLAPKGCSFIYLKDFEANNFNNKLQPIYISWGYHKDLDFNFWLRGTSDKTSWYVVDECIKYYEDNLGGLKKINKYSGDLIERAVDLLTGEWNTKKLEMPKELEAPFMKIIKLPILNNYLLKKEDLDSEVDTNVGKRLQKDLQQRYNVYAAVYCIQNELYIRISCFIYNRFSDYVALKDAILDLQKE